MIKETKLRSLKDNLCGVVDLGVVLMIGIAFVGLMVTAYLIWLLRGQLIPEYPGTGVGEITAGLNETWNSTWLSPFNSVNNVTAGFNNAVNLLLIAITIFILAIAISALLLLRGR